MKKYQFKNIILVVLFSFFLTACNSKYKSYSDFNSFSNFKTPKPNKFTLSNGIKVYFIQDEEVPLVSAKLYMPQGYLSLTEFPRSVLEGLGSLTRAGGTKKLSPEKLDLELLKLSAGISTSVGKEFSSASFSCLSSDISKVLNLFMSVVKDPQFNQKKTNLWKLQYKEGIKRRKDSPENIASLTLRKAIFGLNNPYGKTLATKDVNLVNRTELLRAHRKVFIPDNSVLAIKANLNQEKIKSLLEGTLAKWKIENRKKPKVIDFIDNSKPGIYFVEKDLQQSTVYMGKLGPERLTPDYAEIEIFNNIFGTSGFNSLLMQELREEQGLVYGIYGAITSDVNIGYNIIGFQTKTETTIKAVNESLRILNKMKEGTFTDDNLKAAKQIIRNSHVFKYDSLGKLLKREVVKDLLNYPKNFDETYLKKIMDVTKADVIKVANKYWDIDKLSIIIVGNKTLKTKLKELKLNNLNFKEVTFKELPEFKN